MIINDKDALKRLSSPMNLMNRLSATKNDKSRNGAMSLFIPNTREKIEEKEKTTFNPFLSKPFADDEIEKQEQEQPPVLETLLENHESQIRLGLAHDRALDLLNNSVNMLATKLDDIKADKLPQVVVAAGKIVESIRKERVEVLKHSAGGEVHYHFYTPERKKITDYEVIDVA